MKKILFLLAMLPMMVFTACSSDDDSLESSQYLIPDGTYSITSSELNTRDDDTNWLSINNKLGVIDFYMEPNLSSIMMAWGSPFVENGKTLNIDQGQESVKIEVTEKNKYFIKAIVDYSYRDKFEITLRPKE